MFNIRFVLLHPATWFAIATLGLVVAASQLWTYHRDAVLQRPEFALSRERVIVNSPPAWLDVEMTDLVVEQLGSDRTLLDPRLVADVAEIVETAPWVYRVDKIRKSSQGLDIAVTWREPVALIEIDPGTLIPVDRQAIVLDEASLSASPAESWLRISLWWPNKADLPATWERFEDERIRHALSIVRAIQTDAPSWGVVRVVSWDRPGVARPLASFELWTANGKKIVWGNAPGFEMPGEADVDQKKQAIRSYIEAAGAISDMPAYQKLDIRNGEPALVPDVQTADQWPWRNRLR